jgi:serine/threonine-protein kinase
MLLGDTYRIVRRIGTGGMGEVYEATHERLSHRYAVKVLRPGVSDHPEALARFMREAQVTSRLHHPGIVSVVDFNTLPSGTAYLVMEYLDGESLGKVLARSGPLPLPRVVEITDQISSALTAAHLEGVVHRDIHPQNVFVMPATSGQGERVKILDFGISKIASVSQKLTGMAVVLGTPQYMSPEQAEGKTDDLDAASDQFSLAAIVYEMLTGCPAFTGTTLASVAYQVVHAATTPLHALRPDLPAELEKVVGRALSKNKKDRFPSVSEFALHFRWTARLAASEAPRPVHVAVRAPALARDDEEEPTAVSALPSGMAEVLRQTSGLSTNSAEPTLVSPTPAFLNGEPTVVSTGPFTLEPEPERTADDPAPVRRSALPLVIAGAALVLAGAGALFWTARRPHAPPRPAQLAPAPPVVARTPAPVVPPVPVLPPAPVAPAQPVTPPPPVEEASPPPAPEAPATPPPVRAMAAAAPARGPAPERRPTIHSRQRSAPLVPEAPAPEASDTPPRCQITVGSYPWADLWIDGVATGLQTPVVGLPISCGRHRLEFKRKDLRVDQIESVTVNEGRELKRQVELRGAGVDE